MLQGFDNLSEYELKTLWDLNPDKAEEAISLIPSLAQKTQKDEQIKELNEALELIKNFSSTF